ncbi:unnamed protein product, partial [Rhizoctonia solani]
MLCSLRTSFVIAFLTTLFSTIITLFILSESTQSSWIDKLFLPFAETNVSALLSHQQHSLTLKQECVPTIAAVTRTFTAIQTMTPSVPGPAYCDECGRDDLLCSEYGRHNLQRSRGFEGTNSRLKRVVRKAASGGPINIGVLGGSVTHGHSVVHPEFWTDIFFAWWNQTYPHEKNVFVNGAIPATGTEYFSVCALEHI